MTEIEQHRDDTTRSLDSQIAFARALSAGSMLPAEYRGNPANVLVAMGLGQAMGLSPAESLYRISVIKGKPTASAELIAAQVRKAGHKLRVVTEGTSVKATIVRADDPEFEHTVVRDMAWAQRMGLDKNDNYRKQPETMLQWRAITAAARLACPEALYGVAHTPDELGEIEPAPRTSGLGQVLVEQVNDEPDAAAPGPDDVPMFDAETGEVQ